MAQRINLMNNQGVIPYIIENEIVSLHNAVTRPYEWAEIKFRLFKMDLCRVANCNRDLRNLMTTIEES